VRLEDYPATFQAADAASAAAQARHFALVLVNLGAAFLAACCVALSSAWPQPWGGRFGYAAALLLIVAVGVLWVSRARRDDQAWFDSRAIAESIKSSAWRFMMRAKPFINLDGTAAALAFADQVRQIRAARPGVEALVNKYLDVAQPDVTPFMITTRECALQERKSLYLEQRLLDQRQWYQRQSLKNEGSKNLYFWVVVALQLGAVGVAIAQWRPLGVGVVGLAVTLTASITAWTQARRHDDLAQSYALAVQELGEIRARIEMGVTEDSFSESVVESEAAISREHTMWMVRRKRG